MLLAYSKALQSGTWFGHSMTVGFGVCVTHASLNPNPRSRTAPGAHLLIAGMKSFTLCRKAKGGVKGLNNELMQLQNICQHLFLFDSVEDKICPTDLIDENIWRTSGKFKLLARVLPKLFATGHRVSSVTTLFGYDTDVLYVRRSSSSSR